MSQILRSRMESIGAYLPPKSVETSDIVKGCTHKMMLPLQRLTGIVSRRMAGETEWGYDLAIKAVQDCLAHSQYGPDDIDILINCNISHLDGADRCTFEPSRSARMRNDFGMHHALAFDITNACAGMFTGIYLVDALIKAGAVRRGLVVSGEYITHLTETAQKEIKGIADQRLACLTLGDAGAAVLVDGTTDERTGFHALELYTMGKHSPLCIAKVTDQPHGGAIMVTDMIQLANIAVSAFLQHSAITLARFHEIARQIDHVIPHQTSKTTLDTGSREVKRIVEDRGFKIEKDKLVNNVENRGNTATTSHFVALKDCFASGQIKSGEGVMFGVLASGITVGTAVYLFDDLPERHADWDPDRNGSMPLTPSRKGGTFARHHQRTKVRIESVGLLEVDGSNTSDTLSMLARVAKTCLKQSAHAAEDVDLLLNAGLYRTAFLSEPAVASLVAGLVKMNDNPATPLEKKSLAFDILNGGLGFLNACYLASTMIHSGAINRALITASEVENNAKPVPDHLRGLVETASAVMLDSGHEGEEGFGAFHFRYFPEDEEVLSVYGSAKQLEVAGRKVARLHITKSPDLDQRLIRCITVAVTELLADEGVTGADLAVVIPPQISSPFIAGLATSLDLDPHKFIDVTRPVGDLFTSSLAYGFAAAKQGMGVKSGDLGLIINVAAGVEVGCALYWF